MGFLTLHWTEDNTAGAVSFYHQSAQAKYDRDMLAKNSRHSDIQVTISQPSPTQEHVCQATQLMFQKSACWLYMVSQEPLSESYPKETLSQNDFYLSKFVILCKLFIPYFENVKLLRTVLLSFVFMMMFPNGIIKSMWCSIEYLKSIRICLLY